MTLPLYNPSLNPCQICGACCDNCGTPPFDDDELAKLAPELREPLGDEEAQVKRMNSGQPCLWYDSLLRRCTHYDDRPIGCQVFEIGGAQCLAQRERSPNVQGELGFQRP